MSDLTGKQLNDYHVLRRLGRGAMAEVYLAEQKSLARQVALKVLAPELASKDDSVRRFQHEARAAAALVHANIVQVYEVGQADGAHYMAIEYVPGQNMAECIRRNGRIQPARVLDVLRQVAAALCKAHERSIVHRDVKPENIMLARSGEVKVADFGLARVTTDTDSNLTQAGVTMGTPLYMSPEQINGKSVDSRSDIYSLGVTAYHMLAGEPPFQGETPLAVAVQHVNNEPPPLAERAPDAPPELVALVERMMAKGPEERYADPVALLLALRSVARQAAEAGWAEAPDNWSGSELAALTATHIEATSDLDGLMRGTQALQLPKLQRRRTIRMLLVAGLCGAALAVVFRRPYVLAGSEPQVLAYETAEEQLFHAKQTDTTAAWQAVIEHPQVDAWEAVQARQGLARRHLRYGDYRAALQPLGQLANAPPNQSSVRAFARVALAVAHAKLGDKTTAASYKQRVAAEDLNKLMQTDPELVIQFNNLDL